MKIGIAADHGGFELKTYLADHLKTLGHEIVDFGALSLNNQDDFPDYIVPLAHAVAENKVEKGIAVCGSGVGATVAANKVKGVRACLINDHFSAHQGVEDDAMNIICLGGRTTGIMVAIDLVLTFVEAKYIGAERHTRRLNKIKALENS
jgi:ribose 5-phosphate isomerase B